MSLGDPLAHVRSTAGRPALVQTLSAQSSVLLGACVMGLCPGLLGLLAGGSLNLHRGRTSSQQLTVSDPSQPKAVSPPEGSRPRGSRIREALPGEGGRQQGQSVQPRSALSGGGPRQPPFPVD